MEISTAEGGSGGGYPPSSSPPTVTGQIPQYNSGSGEVDWTATLTNLDAVGFGDPGTGATIGNVRFQPDWGVLIAARNSAMADDIAIIATNGAGGDIVYVGGLPDTSKAPTSLVYQAATDHQVKAGGTTRLTISTTQALLAVPLKSAGTLTYDAVTDHQVKVNGTLKITSDGSKVTYASGYYLAFEATTATTGLIRVPRDTRIISLKSAGSSNQIAVLDSDAGDAIYVGRNKEWLPASPYDAALNTYIGAQQLIYLGINGAEEVGIFGSGAASTNKHGLFLGVSNGADLSRLYLTQQGNGAATDAMINAAHSQQILSFRNNAGAGNIAVIAVSSVTADRLLIGTTSAGGNRPSGIDYDVASGSSHTFKVNGSTVAVVSGTGLAVTGSITGTISGVFTPAYACMYQTGGTIAGAGPASPSDITAYDGSTVTASGITMSTANGTATIDTAGVYELGLAGEVSMDGSCDVAYYLQKNGADVTGANVRMQCGGSNFYAKAGSTIILSLAATDVLKWRLGTDVGRTATLGGTTWGLKFWIKRIA